jgi:putative transcription antitermination factor YqgF
MTHLGIDWGEKNIGLAVSDSSGRFARPLEVVHVNSKTGEHFEKILKVINEWKVEKLVFGLPLGPEGEENSSSRKVRSFAKGIINYINQIKNETDTLDNIVIDFHPEDYTTKQATKGTSRKIKQNKGDSLAAEWLLRGYLAST